MTRHWAFKDIQVRQYLTLVPLCCLVTWVEFQPAKVSNRFDGHVELRHCLPVAAFHCRRVQRQCHAGRRADLWDCDMLFDWRMLTGYIEQILLYLHLGISKNDLLPPNHQ